MPGNMSGELPRKRRSRNAATSGGGSTKPGSAAAAACIERAAGLAMAREVAAIVTAPIHKAALAAAGIGFPGHTEILADRTGTSEFAMVLANDDLRVLLATLHLSLKEAIAV